MAYNCFFLLLAFRLSPLANLNNLPPAELKNSTDFFSVPSLGCALVPEWGDRAGRGRAVSVAFAPSRMAGWLADDPAAAGMLLGRRTGRRGVGRYRAPQNWVLFYRV